MNQQTALLLGATGLIGNSLLNYLLNHNGYGKVIVLTRSPLHYVHPKLQVHLVDFTKPEVYRDKIDPGDVIFCCLGTTMQQVKGDKARYRHIDFEIPVKVGMIGLEKGYTKYVLVSAMGANPQARNFYLKLKGETEEAIAALPFKATHVMRPSLLLGKRMETRFGEMIAQAVMPVLSGILSGKWSKYKAIQATTVARAMVQAGFENEPGHQVHYFEAMQQMAQLTK